MNTGGGVELKRKSIVVFVAFLAMCLVLYWLWHSRGSSTADSGTGAEAKEPQRDTKSDAAPGDVCQWKGQNCLPVPEFLSNTRPRIDEKTVDILYETQVSEPGGLKKVIRGEEACLTIQSGDNYCDVIATWVHFSHCSFNFEDEACFIIILVVLKKSL